MLALLAPVAYGRGTPPSAHGGPPVPQPDLRPSDPLSTVDTPTLITLVPEAGWWPTWDKGRRVIPMEAVELHRRAAARLLNPIEWESLLERQRIICTRARWPRDEPLRLRIEPPFWLDAELEYRVTVNVDGKERVVRSGSTLQGGRGLLTMEPNWSKDAVDRNKGLMESAGAIGRLAPGADGFDLRLEIRSAGPEWYASAIWNEAKIVYIGELHRSIEQVGSVDEVIRPVHSPEVDDAVMRALGVWVSLERWNDSSRHASLSVNLDRRDAPALRGLGIGLEIELRRDARTVHTVAVWADSFGQWAPSRYTAGDYELPKLAARADALRDPEELWHWTVRVRGVGRLALTAWDCDEYWAGEYVLPLAAHFSTRGWEEIPTGPTSTGSGLWEKAP